MTDAPKPGTAITIDDRPLVLRTTLQRKPGHWWAERQDQTPRLWVEVHKVEGEWEVVKAEAKANQKR